MGVFPYSVRELGMFSPISLPERFWRPLALLSSGRTLDAVCRSVALIFQNTSRERGAFSHARLHWQYLRSQTGIRMEICSHEFAHCVVVIIQYILLIFGLFNDDVSGLFDIAPNDELSWTRNLKKWNEAVVIEVNVLFGICMPAGTEKKHITQDRGSPSRDLNPRFPKYETWMIITGPWHSITRCTK